MKGHTKGFTLIELLVVIAIIGILSSVVIANLNTARTKGSDAAVKAQAASIRNQAELDFDSWGNYGTSTTAVTSCTAANSLFAEPSIANQIAALASSSPSVTCHASPANAQTAWSVSAQLVSTSTQYWCVDSAGNSKQESADATSAVCP